MVYNWLSDGLNSNTYTLKMKLFWVYVDFKSLGLKQRPSFHWHDLLSP